MKTYLKTFGKMFKRHFTRIFSVILMVLVSVGFTSGIGMSTEKMSYSLSDEYAARNVSDFVVRGAGEIGEEALAALTERYGEENVVTGGVLELTDGALTMQMLGLSVDITFTGVGSGVTRIYFVNSANRDRVNKLNSIAAEGASEESISVSAERETMQLPGYQLGDALTATVKVTAPFLGELMNRTYGLTVNEIVQSPLHFAKLDDVSMTAEGEDYAPLESVLYIWDATFVYKNFTFTFPANEVYISVPALKQHVLFSAAYEQMLKTEKSEIEKIFADEIYSGSAAVLTLHENFSYQSFSAYEEKIQGISYVFMVVFLLVTLLVVLSTMTRLLEEERAQIACLQTLGYSPMQVVSKYLLFALVGTIIGSVGAYFAGEALSYIIYINFDWNYTLPPYSPLPAPLFFILSAAVILTATLAATLITGLRKTREMPATLLRPHTPKVGRKVFLEHIPLLWNRLSFKYKSTMRNVLRFKMRFIMTVIAVMASTALVLAGLAVLDCCLFQDIGTAAMIGVAIIVLVFAALLNAVVIYTLTNINISERNRELATLMVLGYQEKEVTGYVYREIYITSAVGIALGLPFGCLLCMFVFKVMEFGSLAGISWFVWILAALLSLVFTFAVTLMLWRKITKIDMNESLKAIE